MNSKNINSFSHLFSLLPISVQTRAKEVKAAMEASANPFNALVFYLEINSVSFYSLVIDENHSALCYVENDSAYWFWIGPNAELERMVKKVANVFFTKKLA